MPKRRSKLTEEIQAAIEVPSGEYWATTTAAPVLPLLVGSVAGVVQARALTLRAIQSKKGTQLTWDVLTLGDELNAALRNGGEVQWSRSTKLALWSAGFFLNKSQNNLALALEKCINVWMGALLKIELEDVDLDSSRSDPGDLFLVDLKSRLRIIESMAHSEARPIVSKLRQALDKYTTPGQAAIALRDQGRSLGSSTAPELDVIYSELPFSEQEALAIVCARIKGFRSFSVTNPDRLSFEYPIEIALTAKALKATADLWRTVLNNVIKG